MPTGLGPREDREYWEKKQKDIFGFTFEEKYREINPEKRYMPLVQELMGSKEFGDYMAFQETWKDDKLAQKMFHELMDLEKNLTGHDRINRRYYRGAIQADDYRVRPT